MSEATLQVVVRLLVGIVGAAIGAFFGALVIAMIISSVEISEEMSGFLRIAFVALTATVGSRVGWYGTTETRKQSATIFALSALIGIIGSWVAISLAGVFFHHTDLYILNRDISGAGFFGVLIACNIPPLIYAADQARKRHI